MEAEREVLIRTLSSFALYRPSLHAANQLRRTDYISLPGPHKNLLPDYLAKLESADDAIDLNSTLVEDMMQTGSLALLGTPWSSDLRTVPSVGDLEKIRSTVRQAVRDWSEEGENERDLTYEPILTLLLDEFGESPLPPDSPEKHKLRSEVRVLTPGCGLGRLPFEIARLGFDSVGNEFSYHMLLASNHILNHTTEIAQYQITPFVHSFSNHFRNDDMLRRITVPDVVPANVLSNASFSMAAGEFVESFGNEESRDEFDAIVTCFFLDTAHNVISYLETIRNLLKDGGYWINLGPCLWHHENGQDRHGKSAFDEEGDYVGSVELSMEEIMTLIEKMGFEIESTKIIQAPYMGNQRSMLTHIYNAQLFTARNRKT